MSQRCCVDPKCIAFDRIVIVTSPLGGNLITWGLKPKFKATGPFEFYIDFGRAGTDVWQTVNSSAPVVDDCGFLDINRYQFDQLADYYYRIRLVLPNETNPHTGNPVQYISLPQQANGNWNKWDWLYGRDICRKEYLLQRKRTNMTSSGFLLKRRKWGMACPQCEDFDTGEVINSQCSICYGTGFVGGYFNAVPFTVTFEQISNREFKQNGEVSLTNNIVQRGRAVAYPFIDTKDVFVRGDNGERFIIRSIANLAELGGIPLVVAPELRLAPTTDIIYQVPLVSFVDTSSTVPDPESPASLPCKCGNKYRVDNNQSSW